MTDSGTSSNKPASEEATTGSLETPQALPRLSKLGYPIVRRKPVGGPKELKARHRLLIEYMVNGCPHDGVRHLTRMKDGVATPIEPGEPLSLNEAADIVRLRRRHARELMTFPIMQKEMARAVQALRDGAKAKAMHKIVSLVDNEGQGKAADRKVQLSAAMVVLGETGNSGSQVNVTVNTQNNVSPGYIVKPPSRSSIISGTLNDDRDADDQPSDLADSHHD